MLLPTEQELDAMTALVAGSNTKFVSLSPEARIQILTLANQCVVAELLDNIDTEMTKVGEWFKVSRVYEGL